MKAIRKPKEIDFYLFKETTKDIQALHEWMESFGDKFNDHFTVGDMFDLYIDDASNGTSDIVTKNDVIIRGEYNNYFVLPVKDFNKSFVVLPASLF